MTVQSLPDKTCLIKIYCPRKIYKKPMAVPRSREWFAARKFAQLKKGGAIMEKYLHTLFFTDEEFQKHWYLLSVGATMASYISSEAKALQKMEASKKVPSTSYNAKDAIFAANNWNKLTPYMLKVYEKAKPVVV